jgi:hypothetical protein
MWRVGQTDASTGPNRRLRLTVGYCCCMREIFGPAQETAEPGPSVTSLRISYAYRLLMTAIELSLKLRCLIAKRFCATSMLAGNGSSAANAITDLGCTLTDYVNDFRKQDSASGTAASALRVPACVMRVTTNFGVGTCVRQS